MALRPSKTLMLNKFKTVHLLVGTMITLFCVILVAVSWVVIRFSKGDFEGPFPLQFPGSPKTPRQNSVKYRSWYFASFLDCRYEFFSGFSRQLSFLKNHKERRLMLWLLLASTFSELACLWFATWGLEFYWARKASFFWTWCTKEREQLCLLSGWKMWRLLIIHSIFINLTYKSSL